jgi:hypothetical protein
MIVNFLRAFWRFLLFLFAGIALTFGALYVFSPPGVPRPVARAREAVLEVQRSLNGHDVAVRTLCEQGKVPARYYMRGYEVLAVEREQPDGAVLRTYMRDGRVLAEDGPAPSGEVRRYYRGPCNFASDFFDGSGRLAFLEYDPKCSGHPEVVASEPVPFPPIPVFTYR